MLQLGLGIEIDLREGALVAHEGHIDLVVISPDRCGALNEDSAVLRDDRYNLSFTFESDMAVEAVFIQLLPLVPSVEILVLADDNIVGGVISGLPDFAVYPDERELAVILILNIAVRGIEQADEGP